MSIAWSNQLLALVVCWILNHGARAHFRQLFSQTCAQGLFLQADLMETWSQQRLVVHSCAVAALVWELLCHQCFPLPCHCMGMSSGTRTPMTHHASVNVCSTLGITTCLCCCCKPWRAPPNNCKPLQTLANHCEPSPTTANHDEQLQTIANHYKPLQTMTNHRKPLQTTTNHCKPLQTITNHYKPLQTITNHYKP